MLVGSRSIYLFLLSIQTKDIFLFEEQQERVCVGSKDHAALETQKQTCKASADCLI